ncbi:MAG: YceI family protein [Bacteroidetes bacterium]|nr:YceI family protein [Bacteroidota bacterium]
MNLNFQNIFIVFIILTAVSFAQTKFSCGPDDERNQAVFESNAPLEDIVGVSNKLSADVSIDLSDISNNPNGYVKVELAELKTGIDLRDRHLRSANWLDTDNYPFAEFVLTGISQASSKVLEDGTEVTASASGNLSIHGVTKKITAQIKLTFFKESDKTKSRIAGNLLRVSADFNIKLSDYNISIPSMVAGKVDENIKVSANFVASDFK